MADLAAAFGVSVRHAQRLVNGTAQPTLPADELEDGPFLEAVDRFLASVTLDPAAAVLAEARSLAGKLDAVKGEPRGGFGCCGAGVGSRAHGDA